MNPDVLVRLLLRLRVWSAAKALKDRLRPWTPGGRRQRAAMRRFYAQFIKAGDLCFDIGANVGNRTDVFVELGARVVAVEPQAGCVAALQKKFRGTSNVLVVPKAVGDHAGEGELLVSQAHVLTSMSPAWVERVTRSGRFAAYRWDRTQTVPLTTIDALIVEYGLPSFVKIDVEGYEAQVLQGLSRPVAAISFEFAPEAMDSTLVCIDRLAGLGSYEFNYSVGESMTLQLPNWIGSADVSDFLRGVHDGRSWGDVYARLRP